MKLEVGTLEVLILQERGKENFEYRDSAKHQVRKKHNQYLLTPAKLV